MKRRGGDEWRRTRGEILVSVVEYGMEFRYSAHSVYNTKYHIVFVTKFRRSVLNPGFAKYTEEAIKITAEGMEGVEIEEINVQVEQVHLVVLIPPRYSISKVVEALKGQSAKRVRKRFEWLDKVYWGTRSLWSKGYCVSTIGLNEKQIKDYVKFQQSQDRGQAKLELGKVPRH